jgi:NAD(P)-dependent dehydrogenase (short-subunit alcohol dehydrogenase family)
VGVDLVTGTSSGFGELIALELARRGDTVIATMPPAEFRALVRGIYGI